MPNRYVISSEASSLPVLAFGVQNTSAVPLSIDSQGRLLTTGSSGNSVTVDNIPISAFGDLRSVQLSPVAGWTFNYTLLTNLIKYTSVSTGDKAINNSMIELKTGLSSTGSATIETKKALRYNPGLGALVRFTAIFTTGVVNSQQIIGIGDDSDGFFFGYNGTSFGILVRKNPSNTWIPQASWNIDPVNGSGPSGMTLVKTLGNVYQIEYQWLGFGQITFSVENPSTGQYIPVHVITYANQNTTPSIYNPTLPLRASVTNSGNTSNISLFTPSAMAFVEGPAFTQAISSRYAYYRTLTPTSSNVTDLFTLQNISTFNSKPNRVRVRFDFVTCATNTSNITQFPVLTGAVLTSGNFTAISSGQSVMSYSTDAVYTGGVSTLFLAASVGSSTSQVISDLDIWLAPGEILVFQCQTSSGGSVSASLSWVEYY